MAKLELMGVGEARRASQARGAQRGGDRAPAGRQQRAPPVTRTTARRQVCRPSAAANGSSQAPSGPAPTGIAAMTDHLRGDHPGGEEPAPEHTVASHAEPAQPACAMVAAKSSLYRPALSLTCSRRAPAHAG